MKKDSVIDRIYEVRIRECVRKLKERYPEFLYPLSKLKFRNRKDGSSDPTIAHCLSTDGLTVFYDAKYVDSHVGADLEYDIMHIVVHGMLGHFLHRKEYEKEEFRNSCMDIQVMFLLKELGVTRREGQDELMREVRDSVHGDFTMNSYYRALEDKQFENWLLWRKAVLRHDNHREWDYKEKKKEAEEWLKEFVREHEKELEDFWKQAMQYAGFLEEEEPTEAMARLMAQRKECGSGTLLYGDMAGSWNGTFAFAGKSERNYRELLSEFMTMCEKCGEQPDSIDWMLYQYGFELNEDSPLVEPAEYAEQKAMELVVIAVDVSGSCTDKETMEKFWGETYACVSQWGRNGTGGEFLILQCDATIQKEDWLLAEEFTECPGEVSVSGFGGTSFLPVFQRIDKLKEEGRRIDALIYLTDGDGIYPEENVEYPVYFILPGCNYDQNERWNRVPAWIQTVKLEVEDA